MPKLVNRTARQHALMEAAMQVFAEQGYHRATMQAIADRAGVSKGSLYDYFETKEALLLFTAETVLFRLTDESLRPFETSTGPLQRRIEALVEATLGALDVWSDVCFTVLRLWAELGRDEEQPLRNLMARLYDESATRMQTVFDAAIARGEVAPFPTRATALAIFSLFDGCILQAVTAPEEFHTAVRTGVYVRLCTCMLEPGPGSSN